MRLFLLVLTFLIAHVAFAGGPATPTTRLLLVGGGDRPPEAMKLLSSWAGGPEHAKVLIIGWASEVPEQYFGTISADLRAQGVTQFLQSLKAPATVAEHLAFLADLHEATAVFFSGGNQNRAMAVVDKWNLKPIFTAKFNAGTPFAGTSAGCAMMAETMMTGNIDKVTGNTDKMIGKGLGFMKKSMVDMHFLVRNREQRLLDAMTQAHMEFGIGVDEDGAVAVFNSTDAKVVGEKHVVFYHQVANTPLVREELENQDTFNLNHWKPEVSCPWTISEAP